MQINPFGVAHAPSAPIRAAYRTRAGCVCARSWPSQWLRKSVGFGFLLVTLRILVAFAAPASLVFRAGSGGAASLECSRGVDRAPGLVTGRLQDHVVGRAIGPGGRCVGIARLELDGAGVAGGRDDAAPVVERIPSASRVDSCPPWVVLLAVKAENTLSVSLPSRHRPPVVSMNAPELAGLPKRVGVPNSTTSAQSRSSRLASAASNSLSARITDPARGNEGARPR